MRCAYWSRGVKGLAVMYPRVRQRAVDVLETERIYEIEERGSDL